MAPQFVLGPKSWKLGRRGSRSCSSGTIGKPINLGRTPNVKTTRRGDIGCQEGSVIARKNDDESDHAEDYDFAQKEGGVFLW